MNLFQAGSFKSAAGLDLDWKIECDALTEADWDTLAWLLAEKIQFGKVMGVPTGGGPLARAMKGFEEPDEHNVLLIVDDVWTTGSSMRSYKAQCGLAQRNSAFVPAEIIGAVVFARGPVDDWVTPLFRMDS